MESLLYERQSDVARLEITLKNTEEYLSLSGMEMKELAAEGESLKRQKEQIAEAIRSKEQSIRLLEEKYRA